MVDTLQDALKAQNSLLPWRNGNGRMTFHYIIQIDGACDFAIPPVGHSLQLYIGNLS